MPDDLGHFGSLNWTIVAVFLAGTAWFGHVLGDRSSSLKEFFLGDRKLPWWAVSLSIIASQTSGITLIAVPAAVFAANGNTGYGQLMIGVVIGKLLMVVLFVRAYFDKLIYSPYEFMARRLGSRPAHLARLLFLVSAVLTQAVRLVATAVVVSEVTGLSGSACIFILSGFSAAHCVAGGIRAVIWTDVIQASVFFLGGIFMLFCINAHISMNWTAMLTVLDERAKLMLIDWSLDPAKPFTIWVALFAFPFYELALNSTDQVVTQRLMCLSNAREARKAVLTSCVGTIMMAAVMLAVGLGLVLYYHGQPLPSDAAARIQQDANRIIPYHVVNHLPDGLSALIIAAIFAAGISTLDSALAALSQTSVMGIYRQYVRKQHEESHFVFAAKISVVLWGLVLCGLGVFFHHRGGALLERLFTVAAYAYGPLLGIGLLALMRRGHWPGIVAGTCCACSSVVVLQLLCIHLFWAYPLGAAVLIVTALCADTFCPPAPSAAD